MHNHLCESHPQSIREMKKPEERTLIHFNGKLIIVDIQLLNVKLSL